MPAYWEVVQALLGMAAQYLEASDGSLNTHCASAGEETVEVLTKLGLIKEGKLIHEAFDWQYLKKRFPE